MEDVVSRGGMIGRGLRTTRASRCVVRGAVALGLCLTATVAAANPFGICVHIPNERLLDETAGLGVGWIRIDMLWSLVETERDRFDWSRYDDVVAQAQARGLRIYATVTWTPGWATDGAEGPGIPLSTADWVDFCYRAAARYRGKVEVWGLWNEPNLDIFWEGTLQDYLGTILRPGAAAIHAADPMAMVAGPDLAHVGSANWDGWLFACALGAADDLDIVSFHVYPDGVNAANVRKQLDEGTSGPLGQPSVARVLNLAGWTGRPFWLTETGVESGEQGEYAQSVFYSDLIADWFPSGGEPDWVDAVIFYELTDGSVDPQFTFGIIGPPPEYEHKMAYDACAEAVSEATADDARIVSVSVNQPVTPGRPNTVVVTVENLGTRAWGPEQGLFVGVRGVPDTWTVGGGEVPTTGLFVEPGEQVSAELWFEPPVVGPTYPNLGYDLSFHLTRPDGNWVGFPLRQRVVSGWKPLPEITAEPVDVVTDEGGSARFVVVAESESPPDYQWYRNSRAVDDGGGVAGARTDTLTIDEVTAHDSGEYRCRVTTDAGWVDSRRARLLLRTSGDSPPRHPEGRAGYPPAPIQPRRDPVPRPTSTGR